MPRKKSVKGICYSKWTGERQHMGVAEQSGRKLGGISKGNCKREEWRGGETLDGPQSSDEAAAAAEAKQGENTAAAAAADASMADASEAAAASSSERHCAARPCRKRSAAAASSSSNPLPSLFHFSIFRTVHRFTSSVRH